MNSKYTYIGAGAGLGLGALIFCIVKIVLAITAATTPEFYFVITDSYGKNLNSEEIRSSFSLATLIHLNSDTITIRVQNKKTKEPVSGVSVIAVFNVPNRSKALGSTSGKRTTKGGSTDINGTVVFSNDDPLVSLVSLSVTKQGYKDFGFTIH